MFTGNLTPWQVRYGYEQGAFPMGDESGEIAWYEPYQRALFPISGMHVSRSLRKIIESGKFRVSFDQAFSEVIRGCLRPSDNWITEEIISVYTAIACEGWAHSVEVWEENELVGGSYGLAIGGCFCAESMFHRKDNASKIALWALIEKCRDLGFKMFDAQIMNPHLKSLGAYEISQRSYLTELRKVLNLSVTWS